MSRLAALRTQALSLDEVVAAVARSEAGAIATFSGVVRDHAEGLPVTLLEYEAYASMAEKEIAHILDSIEAELPQARLAVLHRTGKLQVGDLAVVCAASAPHREQAFRACRQCIDRIKQTVPVWKREHGPDGPYWVGWRDARCEHGAHEGEMHRHVHNHDQGTNPKSLSQGIASTSALAGLGVAVLTVSDSRTAANDESGKLACSLLSEAGADISATSIVPDEPASIASWVAEHCRSRSTHAVVITGGTGIAPRDRTIEALVPLFSRTLEGFGEAFRRLSFEDIGARAVLSRATAGVIGSCIVFALPGSPKAVQLALRELVIPLLPHASEMVRATGSHHHGGSSHER